MKSIVLIALFAFFSLSTFSQVNVPVPVETVVQLKTVVNEEPPSISFNWNEIPGSSGVVISRKNVSSQEWKKIHTTQPGITEFTDDGIQVGREYEYWIKAVKNGSSVPVETFVNAGIKCKETEYRGKIILLVDSVFVEPLKFELARLESDLIGDGWEIIRKDISRNSSVKQVKNFISDSCFYKDFPNVNTVFLLGHIPVPYSGEFAFDGHFKDGEHEGAWPADLYYGAMNETLWTDIHINNINSKNPKNHNVSGDGKFDRSLLEENQNVALSIGRVDFFELLDFSQSEVELMRNYLNKNHAFRHKMINPKMQALVDDNLGPFRLKDPDGNPTNSFEVMAISGWRNFTALFNFENTKAGKVFGDALSDSYMWTYGCGWGDFTLCKDVGTTNDFVTKTPLTVFTAFYGSWFGDWDTQNNFLRSALASKGWILTTCWAGRPHYVFHHMGMGETIGNCIKKTQNNYNTYTFGMGHYRKAVNVSLLGDPTLRMHIVSPVKSFNAEITENQTVYLSWNPTDDNILGYHVYKLDTLSNKYERLNSEIIKDNYYTDVSPEQNENYYMVRALQLTQSASGSYYNLSQGIFNSTGLIDDARNISDIDKETESVYPNPFSTHINIETGISGIYHIDITTLNGQLLFSREVEGSEHQLDLSSYPGGVYFVTIRSKDYVTTRKMVKY